jgi:hypothetical protein
MVSVFIDQWFATRAIVGVFHAINCRASSGALAKALRIAGSARRRPAAPRTIRQGGGCSTNGRVPKSLRLTKMLLARCKKWQRRAAEIEQAQGLV